MVKLPFLETASKHRSHVSKEGESEFFISKTNNKIDTIDLPLIGVVNKMNQFAT